MQVHETVSDCDVIPESNEHTSTVYINSFDLNVTIHCFGTILKVEGLEKRLGLSLARSRSRLVAKIRRLGLISVS